MEISHALDKIACVMQEMESRTNRFKEEPDYLPLVQALHDLMIAAGHSAGQNAAFYLECFEVNGRKRLAERRREEALRRELSEGERL